jgi:hypothetical protein
VPGKANTISIRTCCSCKLGVEKPHPSNYRGCSHAKEETRKRKSQRAPKTTGRVFSSSQPTPGQTFAAVIRSNSLNLSRSQLHRPAPSPLRHNQQAPRQSVQAPNANSSSLNDKFTVVATIFQQIMTEFDGAESEEDRIVAITETVLNS